MLIMGAVCMNLIPITLFWRKPYGKIKVPTGVSTPKKQKLSDVKDSSSSNTFPGIHSWHDDGIDNLSYKEDGVPVIAGESNNAVYKEDDVKWIKATYFQDDKPPVVTVIESYLSSEDPENKIASNQEAGDANKPPFSTVIRTVCSNSPFLCYIVAVSLAYPAAMLMVIYMQDMFLDNGFTKQNASLAIILMNLFFCVWATVTRTFATV